MTLLKCREVIKKKKKIKNVKIKVNNSKQIEYI